MNRARILIAALLTAGLAAGGGVLLVSRNDEPKPAPGGGGRAFSAAELKYVLLARFVPLFFCDRDYYPVGSEEGERANMQTWWKSVADGDEEVAAIRAHLRLPAGALANADVLRAYREHKRLGAVELVPQGAAYRFRLNAGTESEGFAVTGTIERDGRLGKWDRRASILTCPICLGGDTKIDTPRGAVRVADLREGMRVWTLDAAGRRVAGTVLRTIRRSAVTPHPMIRLTLADGRSVVASPAHPTADGRFFASLAVGDIVDGTRVASIIVEPSSEPYTYDLLPSGPSGAYWADGVLVGSTLAGPLDLAA